MRDRAMSSVATPTGWALASAADVCSKIQDGTHFSPKVQLSEGKYRYVTAKNVRPWGLDLSDSTYLRDDDHRGIYARCDTRKGDVLLVKDGVNAGDAALNTLDEEVSLLSSVCFLRPTEILRGAFLRYYLQSPTGSQFLTGRLTGTAIRRIVLERVRELPVVVAPVRQQDLIVEAIDAHFSRLDEIEAKLPEAEEKWAGHEAAEQSVTPEVIAEIVGEWTGIPVVDMMEDEAAKLLQMEERLHRRVKGQDDAVIAVSEAIRRARAGLKDPLRRLRGGRPAHRGRPPPPVPSGPARRDRKGSSGRLPHPPATARGRPPH